MQIILYIIIFGFIFIRTELKPIDESVNLKLPVQIENGMNIIVRGALSNKDDQIKLSFLGENMLAEDECYVKYNAHNQSFHLYSEEKDIQVSFKKRDIKYPSSFVLQFNARTQVVDNRDKAAMELYFEGMGMARQSLAEFILLPSYEVVDWITVKGFQNVHNITFSFNRELN